VFNLFAAFHSGDVKRAGIPLIQSMNEKSLMRQIYADEKAITSVSCAAGKSVQNPV